MIKSVEPCWFTASALYNMALLMAYCAIMALLIETKLQ